MIEAHDPRHGSPAGYQAGCREQCCERGKRADRYRRERLARAGHEFQVPRERIIRKVRALHALGWTSADLGAWLGVSGQAVNQVLNRNNEQIWATTAERYDALYAAFEMRVPEDTIYSRRSKNKALREGAHPPLAWEDIDAGVLAQAAGESGYSHERFDEELIDYVLQYHDFEVRLSPLEKSEIVRRWTRSVGSERQLCSLTGWREGRYRSPRPTTEP